VNFDQAKRWFGRTLMIVALAVAAPRPAVGAGLAVVGTGTPGSCTEAALDTALLTGGLITFNCGPAPHTIRLTVQKGLIVNTTFDGGGLITLSGNNLTRHFFVNGGVSAVFRNIKLSDGFSAVGGGAVETAGGYITFDRATVSDNSALEQGGAVYCFIGTDGALTVTNSIFENNRSKRGGALFIDGCPTRISGGLFASNIATSTMTVVTLGGAIYNARNSVTTVNGTEFLRNRAFDGGAINVADASTMLVTGSNFIANSATYGGAIENGGALTVTGSVFDQNNVSALGGALWALDGTTTISGSHFAGNRSTSEGGALYLQASAYVRNTSFIGNSSRLNGGAVYAAFDTTSFENVTFGENRSEGLGSAIYANQKTLLKYVTVYSNTALAGALYGQDSLGVPQPLFVQAVMVAKNAGGSCGGVIVSVRNSVADDTSCGGVFTAPNDKNNATLPLSPMRNSGVTRYYLPLEGNEGVDRLVASDCFMMDGSPQRDQRGVARPQNTNCDSGAIEVRAQDRLRLTHLPMVMRAP
jgi:predicted outer membrane repeat protein